MAVDKNKILDTANKLLQQGKIDRAVAEYQNLLKIDPKNIQIRLKVGDLLMKLKRIDESINEFKAVAEAYTRQGFFPKAIAVYKQILRLDSTQKEVYESVADLYVKMGINADAVNQYRALLGIYEKEGNIKECLRVLKKITEIEPSNLSAKVKLAELLYRQKMLDEGGAVFKAIFDYLSHHKREDDMVTVLERWLVVDAQNLEAIKALSKIYLKRNEPHRLLLKLQAPLKEGVKDPDILEILAESYIQLNKKEKAKPVYKELARIYLNQGNRTKAKDAYEKVLSLDPSDHDARAYLKPPAAPELEIEILSDEEVEKAQVPPPKTLKPPPLKEPAFAKRDELLQRKFVEAEIYLKYGLKDKAIYEYERILEDDSRNIKALTLLKDLYPSVGKGSDAIKHLITLSEISQENGELEEAIRYLEEALTYDSGNREVLERLRSISPETISEPGEYEAEVAEEPLLDELAEAEVHAEERRHDEMQAEHLPEEPPQEGYMDERFAGLMDEAVPVEEKRPEPGAVAVAEDEELQEQFDEIEFYVQQGLADEAKKILRDILTRRPDEQRAKKRLEELEAIEGIEPERAGMMESPVAQEVAASEIAEEEGKFDLARELEDELSLEKMSEMGVSVEEVVHQISAEEVLEKFKSKLGSIVSKEDADTHYDLGIAYKEMGLIDEAIAEFELSSRSPQKEIDSMNMLGLCFREKGDHARAEEHLSKALASPDITPDVSRGILYELAKIYEDTGRIKLARESLEKVVEIDAGFRDSGERLNALKEKGDSEDFKKEEQEEGGKSKKVSYI